MKKLENAFGTLGALFFAICAYPQVYHVWKTQDISSLAPLYLVFWFLGLIFMWVYIFIENRRVGRIQWPIHVNNVLNSFSVLYLLYMKFLA